MKGIYILLGSNLGDRKANLSTAVKIIEKDVNIQLLEDSSVYETAAWGKTNQPSFYNQVLHIETNLTPEKLLQTLLAIENEMGRIRKEKWGERLIDIDILYYNSTVLKTSQLEIPHPGITSRRFTLVPLVEIAWSFLHPLLNKNQKQLLDECPDPLSTHKLTS